MQVLVINRDVDTDRLGRFAGSAAAQGARFSRVPALDAHAPGFAFSAHAALIGPHFWGAPEAKPGAIGCFLSHRRAWQAVLDAGVPRALICEDDAVLTEAPDRLAAIAETTAVDLLFANDRLAGWCRAAVEGLPQLALTDVLARLATRGGPSAQGLKRAPGADCYLVTRRGAERLLSLTASQRIVCGVDWAMVWAGLDAAPDRAMRAAFPELDILAEHLAPVDPPLGTLVLAHPVAVQGGGASVLRHGVTRPISALLGAAGARAGRP